MASKTPPSYARRPPPRVAGRRLQMLAAVLRTPVTGRRLSQLMLNEMGLGAFRKNEEDREAHQRPAVTFRAAPRPPWRKEGA